MQDSIILTQYENAITITEGKTDRKYEGESSIPMIILPLTITNNTDVALQPSDYEIIFNEIYEDTVDGMIVEKAKENSVEGPELPAKSYVEYTISKRTEDIKNPQVKLKISKEKFAEKFN